MSGVKMTGGITDTESEVQPGEKDPAKSTSPLKLVGLTISPKVDPCLICLAPAQRHSLWSTFSLAYFSVRRRSWTQLGGVLEEKEEEEERCLSHHLCSVFILRGLLGLPKSECEELLRATGVDPGDWFAICVSCSRLVQRGLEVKLEARRSLEGIQRKLKRSLKESRDAGRLNGDVEGMEGDVIVGGVHDWLRSRVKEDGEASKTLLERHKAQMKSGGWSDDDDANFPPMPQAEVAEEEDVKVFATGLDERIPDVDTITKCGVDKTSNSKQKRDRRPYPDKCVICGIPMRNRVSYKRHMANHSNLEYVEFECHLCKFVASSKARVYKHCRDIHQSKHPDDHGVAGDRLECVRCNFLTNNLLAFRRHMKRHRDDDSGPVQCHLCGAQVRNADSLRIHVRTVHENWRRYRCNKCGQGFMSKSYLEDHMTKHANNEANPHVCDKCPSSFANKYALKAHYLRWHTDPSDPRANPGNHTKRRPDAIVKCSYCGLQVINTRALSKHLREEHKDKFVFKCDECESAYVSKFTLKNHVRARHSGKGSEVTCVCGRKFPCERNLKRHQSISSAACRRLQEKNKLQLERSNKTVDSTSKGNLESVENSSS